MPFLTDNHFHSFFSPDGHSHLKNIVKKQHKYGIKFALNTEHLDLDPKDDGYGYYDHSKISAKIQQIREQIGMELLHGAEFTYQKEYLAEYENILKRHRFDGIIASIHYIEGLLISRWCAKTEDYSAYFNILFELSKYDQYDIMGHFDYLKKYTPAYNEKKYISLIERILKNIIKNEKILEINTSGLRHRSKEQYPSDNILKIYYDLGGRLISIGSDSHHVSHVNFGYKKVYELCNYIGFIDYHFLIERKIHEIKIKRGYP